MPLKKTSPTCMEAIKSSIRFRYPTNCQSYPWQICFLKWKGALGSHCRTKPIRMQTHRLSLVLSCSPWWQAQRLLKEELLLYALGRESWAIYMKRPTTSRAMKEAYFPWATASQTPSLLISNHHPGGSTLGITWASLQTARNRHLSLINHSCWHTLSITKWASWERYSMCSSVTEWAS